MLINHDITIDLANPTTPARIQVKQGDVMSRNVRLFLQENGSDWMIPEDAEAVIRYRSYDPETQTTACGIFDCLENGEPAYIFTDNCFEWMPTGAMLAKPGLVTVDVVLLYEERSLATFDFEIYVNRAVGDGADPQSQNEVRLHSLDAIHAELNTLRAAIEALGGGAYLA